MIAVARDLTRVGTLTTQQPRSGAPAQYPCARYSHLISWRGGMGCGMGICGYFGSSCATAGVSGAVAIAEAKLSARQSAENAADAAQWRMVASCPGLTGRRSREEAAARARQS